MKKVLLFYPILALANVASTKPQDNTFDNREDQSEGMKVLTFDLHKIPVQHHADDYLPSAHQGFDEDHDDRRFLAQDTRSYPVDPNAAGLELTNYINNQYYATFLFGSSKQPINLLVDTGTSLTWVPSKECP